MSKHIVVIMALTLVASGAHALPSSPAPATYATEAELLSAPGSAGYAVGDDLADVDDALLPLCDGEGDEGEDGGDHGDEGEPGDGGDDGHDGDEGSADGDDEGGC
jgi:hypothetical protein